MELLKLFMPKLFSSFADGDGSPAGDAGDKSAEDALAEELGLEEKGEEEGSEKEEEGKEEEGKEEEEEEDPKKEEEEKGEEIDLEKFGLGKINSKDLKDLVEKGKDYTTKTQELSEKEKSVKELQDWAKVVKGDKRAIDVLIKFSKDLVNDKGEYNGKLLDRMKGALENKVEQTKDGLDAREDELQQELDELDPDSPTYKLVKTSLEQIQALKERLDKAEEAATTAAKDKAEKEYEAQVQHAQQVYKTTLDSLEDPKAEGGLSFQTDSGKKVWRSLVSSFMKDNPKEYKDEEDFVSTLKEVGKACHDTMSKHDEATIAAYLESKGQSPIDPKKKVDPASPKGETEEEEEKAGGITNQSELETAVASALETEMTG